MPYINRQNGFANFFVFSNIVNLWGIAKEIEPNTNITNKVLVPSQIYSLFNITIEKTKGLRT